MATYNARAVQAAINQDKTISKKEGKLIHALLKGRKPKSAYTDRPIATSWSNIFVSR